MSEVKPVHRYKAQTLFSFGGAKIEYFPHGPEVVLATEFDAQRLRADTAEALSVKNILMAVTPGETGSGHEVFASSVQEVVDELGQLADRIEDLEEKLTCSNFNYASLYTKYAAAEQRIAELKSVFERMLEDDDMPVHWFAQRIDAALNPNPEAESHE